MAGGAICRPLYRARYTILLTATHAQLDLEDSLAVQLWFAQYQPSAVVLAAAANTDALFMTVAVFQRLAAI
ncbi:hypothetical protein [Synechococcus sp. BIOS-U3-1]|uniref:hypothetical protein n=1 Tax=Synechococcus sp. BIOS-U3-1 TaxID=1400865 RepID=UPI001648FB29|nr:hypothetical protein [Synechococcus sp. BIOS-U3-1]